MADIKVSIASPVIEEEEINAVIDVMKSGMIAQGPKVIEFEEEFAKFVGAKYGIATNSGTSALHVALLAAGIGEGDEVITTPFTFVSTTHAIVRNGLTPVFCDINPITYCIDTTKIESLITDKTCAIMPVHVYGNICDVEEIERIAKKYGLKVIYDAAHAFGEKYKGKGVMNYGDMSMLSFHATKVFHTIEGGAICYHKDEYKNAIYKLRDFGIKDEETIDVIGSNAKMNEFAAAMGLCNLNHIDQEISKRKKAVELYRDLLKDLPGVQLNYIDENVSSNYAYFPVVIHEDVAGYTRNEMADYLKGKNIYARKYFYPLTNAIDCFDGKFELQQTPVALHISKRVLTLPLFADITEEEVRRVCSAFIEWKEKANE